MSLVTHFKSITETKILMLEVSKGKRRALLKKMVNHFFDWDNGDNKLRQRVLNLIDNHPIIVERLYGQRDEFYVENTTTRKRKLKEAFGDELQEIFDKLDFAPKYQNQNWWGVLTLMFIIEVFRYLEQADPTNNMTYGNWLVDTVFPYALETHMLRGKGAPDIKTSTPNMNIHAMITSRNRFEEDIPKLNSYLKAFDEMKKKNELPDEYRDINNLVEEGENPIKKIATITKGWRVLEGGDYFEIINEKLDEGKDYKKVFNDVDGYSMYLPLNEKAKSILGAGTEWCTTYGEYCMNPDYQDRRGVDYDNLIILVENENPMSKIQIHFGTGQFMDEDDVRVKPEVFFTDHPDILNWCIEIKPDEVRDWLMGGGRGAGQFMRIVVAYDKYNELFEMLLSELELLMPKNLSNDGTWYLEYSEGYARVITTDVEWMKNSFGGEALDMSVEDFLYKYLETSPDDVARTNKGYEIGLNNTFARAWIVHYNNIVDFHELRMYQ